MDRSEIRDNVRLTMVLEDTNVTDAQLNTIINQGIEEIAIAEDWPWLEASATISFVADTQTYSLPADWNRTEKIVDDDNDTTIPYISASTFFQNVGNDTGNSSDTPNYFTIWESKIYISPIPSSADTNRLTHYYYKNPTTLSTDGATPEWDVAFHWILVEYAKWKLYEREEYYDVSERAFVNYARYMNDMAAFYNTQVNRALFIYGDGLHKRFGDPNIPSLRTI